MDEVKEKSLASPDSPRQSSPAGSISVHQTNAERQDDQKLQSMAETTQRDSESAASFVTETPPSFPQLCNNPSATNGEALIFLPLNGEDEDLASTKPFRRSTSPPSTSQKPAVAAYQKVGEEGICKMHKFSLYETTSRYYLVGGDIMDRKFRILKIDRTVDSGDLSIAEDEIVYTKKEMNQLLNAVDDGNRNSGGLKFKCISWGLLGFIKFTGAYYVLLITKRSQVAMIGGHFIYQIDGTEMIPLTMPPSSRFKATRNPEEARFLGILNNLDLSRSFYFSYTYDVTHTLQCNISYEREALRQSMPRKLPRQNNAMFVWNNHLLESASKAMKSSSDWCLPIMHGFVDQATLSIYGRTVYITLIARRSRLFAGARYLKRGANDLGYVANDVETEQIVSEMLTTSFHAPGPNLYANPNYTSYVQHRGSIPLHWTQDNTGVSPKPDIQLNLVDPFYSAAALHFDDLFKRYGAPVFVLNLVKARERTPRESILLHEYTNAISYLNQFLPEDKKIIYRAWDMSRASKSRDQDVIGILESIAEEVVTSTGFFRSGRDQDSNLRMQNGVARTNCIDCLDRTNAAQFVIGKKALGHQLHALGIIDETSITYDTDAVNLFTHMYHDHGDTIAVQYGGSHLVNRMETYRKINQWTSHSRDMVESFKRYYNNSFLDAQRQEAYNLFLGNYVFAQGQPMLWDLSTDYYLHHTSPRGWFGTTQKSYVDWFDPVALESRSMPSITQPQGSLAGKPLQFFDDYWVEHYRPLAISSYLKIFSFRMNSTLRYMPFKSTQDGKYDLSPFKVRSLTDHDALPEKAQARTAIRIADSRSVEGDNGSRPTSSDGPSAEHKALPTWLQSQLTDQVPAHQSIMEESYPENPAMARGPARSAPDGMKKPKDKSAVTQLALAELVRKSLNPSVVERELHEYKRYITHPLNLPLVISTEIPANPNAKLLRYVNSVSSEVVSNMHPSDDDLADFEEFLEVGEEPLTVTEADPTKKRYKAYRQWLKGRSLFKQHRLEVDGV